MIKSASLIAHIPVLLFGWRKVAGPMGPDRPLAALGMQLVPAQDGQSANEKQAVALRLVGAG